MKRFRSIISPGREKRSRAGGGEGGGERERGGREGGAETSDELDRESFEILQHHSSHLSKRKEGRKEERNQEGTRKEPGRIQSSIFQLIINPGVMREQVREIGEREEMMSSIKILQDPSRSI